MCEALEHDRVQALGVHPAAAGGHGCRVGAAGSGRPSDLWVAVPGGALVVKVPRAEGEVLVPALGARVCHETAGEAAWAEVQGTPTTNLGIKMWTTCLATKSRQQCFLFHDSSHPP